MKHCCALLLAWLFFIQAGIAHAETRLTFATGGTSGVYFPLGSAIAQTVSAHSDLNITAQATGASGENMRLIENRDVNIAIVQNDIAHAAFHGQPPFREKLTNARAIARLYPEYLHVVANRKSGIKTITDFKGKRISVGARGSGNELNCRQIFSHFGLTYKNLKPIFLPYGETAEQFKDSQIDAFVFTIGTPNPAIQDITTAQEVYFVPLEGKEIDDIVKKFPFMVKDAIPENIYKGQTKAVKTLSVQALLIVSKDTPDDVAYTLTKTLFEHLPELTRAHTKAAEISLARAKDGVTIPFHPGALKYYSEQK